MQRPRRSAYGLAIARTPSSENPQNLDIKPQENLEQHVTQ